MPNNLPKAIAESQFTILGVTLKCYVLDDGQRIIDAEDIEELFEAMAYPRTIEQSAEMTAELAKFTQWRQSNDR